MKCDSPDYAYLVVDGIENVLAALDDIKQGRLKKCFIEMSICAGSCIGGPAIGAGAAPSCHRHHRGEPLRRPEGLRGGPSPTART